MQTLDDVTLIQQFIARQTIPSASSNLRIESALNVIQLLTQSGELLVRFDRSTEPAIVQVKQGIQSWEVLHQILSEHGFMLVQGTQSRNLPDELGFICYEAQQIPTGYQMHCTEAKTLWKVWSAQVRSRHQFDRRLELLLVTPNAWLPIQDVSCDRGVVSIKTLIKATSLQEGDYVTWLQKARMQGLKHDRQPIAPTPKDRQQLGAKSLISRAFQPLGFFRVKASTISATLPSQI